MAKRKAQQLHSIRSPISELLGAQNVLPGESREDYQNALMGTVRELEADTPLKLYLAEQIFDCLWWMRRYEALKQTTLLRHMAHKLNGDHYYDGVSPLIEYYMANLQGNVITSEFAAELETRGYSVESLQQDAFSRCDKDLLQLDQMIALKAKTLAGFQASYEILINRKITRERLELQNQLLRRDIDAIEHDQSAQTSGKPG